MHSFPCVVLIFTLFIYAIHVNYYKLFPFLVRIIQLIIYGKFQAKLTKLCNTARVWNPLNQKRTIFVQNVTFSIHFQFNDAKRLILLTPFLNRVDYE